MIECRDQTDMRTQQHSVAEYIPAHVAHAHHGKVLCLGIAAKITEMSLN